MSRHCGSKGPAWPAIHTLLRRALAALLLAGALLATGAARAEDTQPYGVSEFPIHADPGVHDRTLISGSRVIWHEGAGEVKRIYGRNLATGQEFMFSTGDYYGDYDLDGDLVVTGENNVDGQKGIFAYRLPDFSRVTVAALAGGPGFYRMQPKVSGKIVVWAEGNDTIRGMDIYAHDLGTGQTFPICTNPAQQERPAISGNVAVWLDGRNRSDANLAVYDIYGYDLAAKREFRITAQPEPIGPPAISGNTVVWMAFCGRAYCVRAYDIASGSTSVLANVSYTPSMMDVDVDGDLVVWSARVQWPAGDYDLYGYDLAQKKQFVISRAIGDQTWPSISGRTVVWVDGRHRSLNKYDQSSEVYGAALAPGAGAIPPIIGAPTAVDARIEIVWPHGGVPVTQADRANVGAYLLLSGTLKPAPCQWHPQALLWRALNNEPARPAATGGRPDYSLLWEFNNVDVAAARDPRNRIFFFVTVPGTPSRTNIWAHAADARTYFPNQDIPTGIAQPGQEVDAKIEIVWPHDGAPVSQAGQANVTAALFIPRTLDSVPAGWDPAVRLWRSLNDGVAEPWGVGQRRLVTRGGLTYPVWDFNNVDVSAARDPANKYYFYLSVDGVYTYSNVWAHGADARTYFPEKDALEGDCS